MRNTTMRATTPQASQRTTNQIAADVGCEERGVGDRDGRRIESVEIGRWTRSYPENDWNREPSCVNRAELLIEPTRQQIGDRGNIV